MILLQLSSAQGPEECCLAVKKALDRLIKEAARQDVAVTVLETETGRYSDTLRSALVSLDGLNLLHYAQSDHLAINTRKRQRIVMFRNIP